MLGRLCVHRAHLVSDTPFISALNRSRATAVLFIIGLLAGVEVLRATMVTGTPCNVGNTCNNYLCFEINQAIKKPH